MLIGDSIIVCSKFKYLLEDFHKPIVAREAKI